MHVLHLVDGSQNLIPYQEVQFEMNAPHDGFTGVSKWDGSDVNKPPTMAKTS